MQRQPPTKPSVCFLVFKAYGALRGQGRGHIGGAERQAVTIARWLAAKNYRVSFVTWDEGQPDAENIDGITVMKLCRSNAGLRGLRFVHPRMTSFFSAMRRASADIYYHTTAEFVTGLAAWWCRANRRRFIYSVASDVDCEPSLRQLGSGYERVLFRWGLRHTDKVFVQTQRQGRLLKESYGLGSVVLPMGCDFSTRPDQTILPPASPPRVAWVGRVITVKRLEWLLDIAEKMPEIQFDVVAPNMDSNLPVSEIAPYVRGLHDRAKSLPNIVWRGRVSQEELTKIYQDALCLCCTSIYEGFPNTFLEAWSHGRPVVSSFDPDGLIASRNLGTYVTGVAEFVTALRQLAASPAMWREQSERSRAYFFQTHAMNVAMPRFEHEFIDTWAGKLTPERELPEQQCTVV